MAKDEKRDVKERRKRGKKDAEAGASRCHDSSNCKSDLFVFLLGPL